MKPHQYLRRPIGGDPLDSRSIDSERTANIDDGRISPVRNLQVCLFAFRDRTQNGSLNFMAARFIHAVKIGYGNDPSGWNFNTFTAREPPSDSGLFAIKRSRGLP
ncbi:MAG: hypothetical protein HKN47_08610 [Pirellulaceae bacterium]|nr:hypothetical protein [Pirellulaceae bacterium]